ncbi:MAG TPA: hypothetical protein ENJ95_23285 [Bacteroidetes bacterium]|nr:hypothetical protein [Bacteroidota bacterium]
MKLQDHKKLNKWLNKLQRESWELELVTSGFSIFLMLGALEALKSVRRDISIATQAFHSGDNPLSFVYIFLMGACFFILINLVVHVLLRGVWISTIGLRYVSSDIDFDSLRLAPKFDRLLRRKVGSFDQYILTLEKICSTVFAFTFLIVFMLLGFALYIGFMIFIGDYVLDSLLPSLPATTADIISDTFGATLFVCGVLYFLDFLTLGFLKRIKWFSYIYMPIYRFMSFITVSPLYRPIYYNLIDNKFGRWVGYLLVPYVFIIIFLLSVKTHSHTWYPDKPGANALLNNDYDDQLGEKALITSGSIPSKFVDNGFLQLFIAYMPKDDDKTLKHRCPGFEPFHEAGFGSDIQINLTKKSSMPRTNARDTALTCLSQLYEISIDDSLFSDVPFRFHRHANYREYGLAAMFDVAYLPRGEHLIEVKKWKKYKSEDKQDSLALAPFFKIPFWKE